MKFPSVCVCVCVCARKSLIKLLKGHSKLVSEAYHSILSLDEDQMPHELQPGDYLC